MPSKSSFTLKVLRKKSRVVPEGNGPTPQDAYVMLGGITLEELRRVMMSETWDEVCDKNGLKRPETAKDMKATGQRSSSLEHDAR